MSLLLYAGPLIKLAACVCCRRAASTLGGMDVKAQKERDAVYHIQSMYRGLAVVGPLQGLCKQYKQAKARSWQLSGVKGKPVVRPLVPPLQVSLSA